MKKQELQKIVNDDLEFKIWVVKKLSEHDAYIKILLILVGALIGIVVLL